jgi:hypothetical protein
VVICQSAGYGVQEPSGVAVVELHGFDRRMRIWKLAPRQPLSLDHGTDSNIHVGVNASSASKRQVTEADRGRRVGGTPECARF